MNDQELDRLLSAVPSTASPPHDPWPLISRRLEPRRAVGRMLAAAAAVILFGAGVATGWAAASGSRDTPESVVAFDASPTFLAATRVQSTGSAYVAAVSELASLRRAGGIDDLELTQGYEAALAAVEAVAGSVAGGAEESDHLAGAAAEARRAMGRRVTALLWQGGGQ